MDGPARRGPVLLATLAPVPVALAAGLVAFWLLGGFDRDNLADDGRVTAAAPPELARRRCELRRSFSTRSPASSAARPPAGHRGRRTASSPGATRRSCCAAASGKRRRADPDRAAYSSSRAWPGCTQHETATTRRAIVWTTSVAAAVAARSVTAGRPLRLPGRNPHRPSIRTPGHVPPPRSAPCTRSNGAAASLADPRTDLSAGRCRARARCGSAGSAARGSPRRWPPTSAGTSRSA